MMMVIYVCLECFDTVDWAIRKTSGPENLLQNPSEWLLMLSGWSTAQGVVWV